MAQKDREIRDLKLELEDLKSENARLRASGKRPHHRKYSTQDDAISTKHLITPAAPSYSRPTVASVRKIQPVADDTDSYQHISNTATIQGVSYYYVDGLISGWERTNKNTGYLNHTEASATKTVCPHRAREDGITYTTEWNKLVASWSTQEFDEDEQELQLVREKHFYSLPSSDEFDAIDGSEVEALENSTRLRDSDFYSTPAGRVRIHFDDELRYMNKAYAVAQDALHNATRQRWPEAWRRYYLDGPRTVRFGFTELEHTIGREPGRMCVNGVCTTPPTLITTRIFSMIDLRNAIAHPTPHGTSNVDRLMERAQALACALQDEIRAKRVRQLRDDMQQRARKCFDEIVAYEPLSFLPGARPWALCHQKLFASITNSSNPPTAPDEDIELYGAAVYRAAVAWRLRDRDVGTDDPYYTASLHAQSNRCSDAAAKKESEDAWTLRSSPPAVDREAASAEVEWPAVTGSENTSNGAGADKYDGW